MKIKIEFTVDINVEAWCLTYGDDPSEVREAVKRYVEYGAKAQFDGLDLTTKPTI